MSTYEPYVPTETPGYYPQPEPPQYPVMPYPMPIGRPDHPQETAVFVLGILGVIFAGILGPIAWIMGNKALKDCAAGMYTATDQLKAGRVLGIVGTVLLIVEVIAVIIVLIAFAAFVDAVTR